MPSWPKRLPMARPIPPAPPVTTATLPRRSFIVGIVTWSRISPQPVALCDHVPMAPRPSPQTERVVNLVEHLAADGSQGMTLAEVSRHLSVHKASCHWMLSELLRAGWLLRAPVRKTYPLGSALVRLGREAAGRYPALVLARSAMVELSAATGAHCVA